MGLTYNVMPMPRAFFVDTNGAPYAGGKLYAWQSGGLSVPQDTYADSIGTPNANPVVLDAAGRWPIYLAPKAYAFELRDANGVQIWTQDPVYGYSLTTDFGLCGGRLTLTTGVPVTTADVTAATSVIFTPYKGGALALFDGTSVWGAFTFSEISIAVPALANQMYDVFASQTAGVVSLSVLAWTNDTTRATAITLQNGVLVKSGSTTNRYLGSFRTTTVAGQTEDSFAKRYLWNWCNRVRRAMRVNDPTDTWPYTTATWRQANGNTANQLDFVIGVAEIAVYAEVLNIAANDNAGVAVRAGIGLDVTNANATGTQIGFVFVPVANYVVNPVARLMTYPAVGRHFLSWLEFSGAGVGTTTWRGDNGTPADCQAGISGWTEA